MSVTLHQPVAGMDRGETYTGPLEAWLVANGYASDGAKTDKVDVTGVEEKDNPMLAEHREAPGEDVEVFGEKLAADEDHAPVENGSRDPEPLPVFRNRLLGVEESDEAAAQTEALDGSVAAEDVSEKAPQVVKRPRKAAAKAAGTSAHRLEEPAPTVEGEMHGVDGNLTDK